MTNIVLGEFIVVCNTEGRTSSFVNQTLFFPYNKLHSDKTIFRLLLLFFETPLYLFCSENELDLIDICLHVVASGHL